MAYVALALGTIPIGLLAYFDRALLSVGVRDVLGDVLWATMIAWWIGALVPRTGLALRGVITVAICFAVEFGQLIESSTLYEVRRTTVGHLVLGSSFDSRDLGAYALGVGLAILIERVITHRSRRRRIAR